MQDVPSLSPIVHYALTPLWIAIGLVGAVGLLYGGIFWVTRKKPQKVLGSLPPAPPVTVDISRLRQQYLHEIDRLATAYHTREIRARVVHQELSRLLKSFVAEAEQMPIKTMTLSDLKKTKHDQLTAVIETYYRPEFAAVETGNVTAALDAARKVVNEWS